MNFVSLGSRILRKLARLPRELAISPGLHRSVSKFLNCRGSIQSNDIREAKTILVLKPDEIGDVVLATVFLRSLRDQCPCAHITLVVGGPCFGLASSQGLADEVKVLPKSWRGTVPSVSTILQVCFAAWSRWSKSPPDWVLIPRSELDVSASAYYAFWTGSSQIVGHEGLCEGSHPSTRLFFHAVVPRQGARHEVEYHAAMLSLLGLEPATPLPVLHSQKQHDDEVLRLFGKNHLPCTGGRFLVTLGIGANIPAKVWPVERYLQLAQWLSSNWPEVKITLIGSEADQLVARELCRRHPGSILDATGQLSILGTYALLCRTLLHIGNDSGPMHLAACAGATVVAIFRHPQEASDNAFTSPVRFGPLAIHKRILQPVAQSQECQFACLDPEPHCILGVSTQMVIDAVRDLRQELHNSALSNQSNIAIGT